MNLLTDSGPTTLIVLVMLVLVIGWVLFRTHRAFSRHRDESTLISTPRPQPAEPGHHLDAPSEMLRWEVQMHETGRELSAQLDSKMVALQALIADADRAAARLEAAQPQATRCDPKPTTQAEALLPAGGPDRIGQDVTVGGSAESPSPQHGREEICYLADAGHSPAEIAGRVGRPIGEVELILGLRNKH